MNNIYLIGIGAAIIGALISEDPIHKGYCALATIILIILGLSV